MYKHILIPTDGSELASKAVKYGARVTAITVTRPFHSLSVEPVMLTDTHEEYDARVRKLSERILAGVQDAATSAAVQVDAVHVEHESPYEAILKAATARDCDLVVMASHGRSGVAALVLGSETVKVLTHSTIPVLVYR